MFIATLFTIAKTWKQPRYSSTDKCIKKIWYIYTVEYYSAIKKEQKFVSPSEVEPVMQREFRKGKTNTVY